MPYRKPRKRCQADWLTLRVQSTLLGSLLVMVTLWGLCAPAVAAAQTPPAKPLWEAGIAGGGGLVPDYPAADEHNPVGLVLPYVIYRGRIFRAGDDGIARGRFLRGPRHEFDVSLSGSFPADSDGNEARRGMPDLDLLVEVGPRLKLTLAELSPQEKISLELPVRAVVSVDFSEIGYRGIVFHPKLAYLHTDPFNIGVQLRLSAGPIFATAELMEYFYEVEPRFATPNRPAFDAGAGYLGSEFSLLARKQLTKRIGIFGAIQVGYYGGATNDDSPLFRSEATVGFGVGFTWSIFQSKQQVAD